MMKGIIGRKVGMSQMFDEQGTVIPVTLIEAGPCYVTQKKTSETDGYAALQLGYGEVRNERVNRPQAGHLKKAGVPSLRYLREFRVQDHRDIEVGQKIEVSIFEVGDRVDVVGLSKGKGTAGAVKRHGFAGGPKTHGQSDRWRAPGSIGATSTPGRVFKGMRMPGRMGNERVTVQNLRVELVDPERNLLVVRGAVPGARTSTLVVREARKAGG
jgi:large subunit ribosomal protein L3